MASDRIFCPDDEFESLPEGLNAEERYPAFVVVTASAEAIAKIRKRYPVEALSSPKPAPAYPAI
jgi:hypothetical protein